MDFASTLTFSSDLCGLGGRFCGPLLLPALAWWVGGGGRVGENVKERVKGVGVGETEKVVQTRGE